MNIDFYPPKLSFIMGIVLIIVNFTLLVLLIIFVWRYYKNKAKIVNYIKLSKEDERDSSILVPHNPSADSTNTAEFERGSSGVSSGGYLVLKYGSNVFDHRET